MLVEAEKFASADKVKRENIDVKNQAEALCFEAEKEVSSFNDTVPENKKQNIKTLIENIRQEVQTDNFETLKEQMEELKTAMKDIVALKSTNDTATDPMSNLNDL